MNKRRGFTPLEIKIFNRASKRFLTGFTLIELLVVIAIIALLMSILMPALSKAKRQAQAVMCQSNQHQFGLLWKFYTDDNKGFFPERGHSSPPEGMNGWHHELEPYYGDRDILFCPAATKLWTAGAKYPFAAWTDQTEEYNGSYCVNLLVANGGGEDNFDDICWRTPNTKAASYAPLLADGNWKDMEGYVVDTPPPYYGYGWTEGDVELQRVCIPRHGGKDAWFINISYLDFSMRKIDLKEIWVVWWHKDWRAELAAEGVPTEWDAPDHWMFRCKDYFF
jgi:prepilin-type N-terminal cleavage/methylation domain-containing protein